MLACVAVRALDFVVEVARCTLNLLRANVLYEAGTGRIDSVWNLMPSFKETGEALDLAELFTSENSRPQALDDFGLHGSMVGQKGLQIRHDESFRGVAEHARRLHLVCRANLLNL